MIILGNIFIFILTPILAEKLEHHHTFGSKEVSCFLKMYCFQVFNTVVASSVFHFWAVPSRHSWCAIAPSHSHPLIHTLFLPPSSSSSSSSSHTSVAIHVIAAQAAHAPSNARTPPFRPPSHRRYAFGAAMVFNVLIGDLFVIQIFMDLLQPAVLLKRHYLAPKTSTQREMNDAYSAKADIYVAFRLQVPSPLLRARHPQPECRAVPLRHCRRPLPIGTEQAPRSALSSFPPPPDRHLVQSLSFNLSRGRSSWPSSSRSR